MKLPNWILIFSLLIMASALYTANAQSYDLTQLHLGNEYPNAATSNNLEELEGEKTNINTASSEELSALPGIGKKKADAIVNYRNINGQFMSIEELSNVKGIGSKLMAKLEDLISI